MEATEAINLLVRAGRQAEATKAVDDATNSAHAAYKEIDADTTRTADYKREAKNKVYEQTRAALNTRLNQLASSAKESERLDVARAFGTSGVAGDAASLIISRRDAVDRVDQVKEADGLRDLLDRATRTRDEVLARAVAEKAMELGDSKTLYKFLEDRPQLDDVIQRLWDARQRSSGAGLGPAMALWALRPN